MPTLFEVFFWIATLIVAFILWYKFTPDNSDYVSEYELDRLNGDKY